MSKLVSVTTYLASELEQSARSKAYWDWLGGNPAEHIREEGYDAIASFLTYFGIAITSTDNGRVDTNYHSVYLGEYSTAKVIADYHEWETGLWLSELIYDAFTSFVMDYPDESLEYAVHYAYTKAGSALEEEIMANESEAAFLEWSDANNFYYFRNGVPYYTAI